MTRLVLHVGPEAAVGRRIAAYLAARRGGLARRGILYPRAPGRLGHARLALAVSDPDRVDSLRFNRGLATPAAQARLRAELGAALCREIEQAGAETVILCDAQLGAQLVTRADLERLRALLAPVATDVEIVAHVDDPARAWLRHLAEAVHEGRARPLQDDLDLATSVLEAADGQWWQAALAQWPAPAPARAIFPEVQGPPPWLDAAGLVAHWEAVFGAGTVRLRPFAAQQIFGAGLGAELAESFSLAELPRAEPEPIPPLPSAETLLRAIAYNRLLLRWIAATGTPVPRQLWRRLVKALAAEGAAPEAGRFAVLSAAMAPRRAAILARWPELEAALRPDRPLPPWRPAPFSRGFRPSQRLWADLGQIRRSDRNFRAARLADLAVLSGAAPAPADSAAPARHAAAPPVPPLSPAAEALMPAEARALHARIAGSWLCPQNLPGRIDEESETPPYAPSAPAGDAGRPPRRVVIACMKDEAPYLLEWIAYHRCVGFDHFLIYSNDCSDGTDTLLDRLAALGLVTHRRNDAWKGKSPQQHALNMALREEVVRRAEWLAHFDVDEFVNVRCGNGTLDDFLARVPDATNVAMTWRLFGHGGIREIRDAPVIAQFTECAPRHCPKPHTAWGLKTMTRNVGAYGKLSCHRPNKPVAGRIEAVRWVNGNGEDVTGHLSLRGWRSSRASVGYDLLQLNHYAVRSADGYLVKRQRGRALHVDRTIGLNYWIRMDWSGARDVTIRRNLPRLEAALADLRRDPELDRLHREGLAWHRRRAAELRRDPEVAELYDKIITLRLTPAERAAWAMALDMDS